ncbi:MAG TPA: twin-arginine translocase TatA/TatE family subunit [Anaerolineaceae bacterium]|nr:twin-arginine translocase TatA/TatE family subunit [Chloroflexota bacterium]HNY84782.1 twin-arginine translocase TatA/TatE family subunit [Anaerolineaceae bacterium]
MGHLGWPEVIIILVVLLLVFGVGRITTIGGELGAGIKAFKEGLSGKRNDEAESEKSDNSGEVKK